MKKSLLLIFVFFFTLTAAKAKKELSGIIVYEKDTVAVTFLIPINVFTLSPKYLKLQEGVKYLNAEGKRKKIYPEEAKEIQFEYLGENIRMISKKYTVQGVFFSSTSVIFLKMEVDGYLKLFLHQSTQTSSNFNGQGSTSLVTSYVVQKGNGEFKKLPTIEFRYEMTTYFNDCPELVTKLEEKVFRKRDRVKIVEFYNANCHNN